MLGKGKDLGEHTALHRMTVVIRDPSFSICWVRERIWVSTLPYTE
jgi:hypothetical protein